MSAEYVIAASVAVQRMVRNDQTPYVRTLFRLAADGVLRLWAPEFCLAECTNVLWKAVRFQGMDAARALTLSRDLSDAPLHLVAAHKLLPRALELGIEHNSPIYDTVYIALAETQALPLITVDRRQARIATAHGVTLKPITDFSPT